MTKRTIAQIVYDNELYFGYSNEEIRQKLLRIWEVMDDCIRAGVSASDDRLPGRLGLRRRAPMLYRRLMRGFYPGLAQPHLPALAPGSHTTSGAIDAPEGDEYMGQASFNSNNGESRWSVKGDRALANRQSGPRIHKVVGSFDHPILPMPPRKTMIPAMDFLSCYAIAVNEVNASGGRIVTSPTNGAAGIIPAVLKYIIEFVSDDPEKSIETFLLTAAAVGMLFKRGSTISAAEGGCQAEVGVACSMASAGFAACMGADPETVLQAAEIGIEHNLGLTCDPIDGLVQVPCIERNSLGAVKAVTAAQLSMASQSVYSVTLDEAIEAMRLTAADMSVKYKETSLSGLANRLGFGLIISGKLSLESHTLDHSVISPCQQPPSLTNLTEHFVVTVDRRSLPTAHQDPSASGLDGEASRQRAAYNLSKTFTAMIPTWLSTIASIGMAVGPPLVYADQAYSIVRKQDATGFSRDVCAILLLANITRCYFWLGDRFDPTLLYQSLFMIFAQLALLYICIRYRPKSSPESLGTSTRPLSFWQWPTYTQYIEFLAGFVLCQAILFLIFGRSEIFVAILGYVALGLESTLPIPQLLSNFKQKSLYGFRASTLIGWVAGDSFKTVYFFVQNNPLQFKVCAIFQLSIDFAIIVQRLYYGNAMPAAVLETEDDLEQALALAED
ncbi:hypothetical protein EIP86_009216 [Pleurotus ostreatoroseus]|nr:hypothetical protein EIP86_009216 [Pleurotus ostreatoroseus]